MVSLTVSTRNVVCPTQEGQKGEQVKDPRESEGQLVMSWIGPYGLTGNGADFEGGQEREKILKELSCHGMLDAV